MLLSKTNQPDLVILWNTYKKFSQWTMQCIETQDMKLIDDIPALQITIDLEYTYINKSTQSDFFTSYFLIQKFNSDRLASQTKIIHYFRNIGHSLWTYSLHINNTICQTGTATKKQLTWIVTLFHFITICASLATCIAVLVSAKFMAYYAPLWSRRLSN